MGENYPWSKLNDDQITPGTLDPNKFPIRPSKPSQRWWNDYWYNNPHGGLISPSPGAPLATPFAGFTPGRPETGVEAAKERYGGDGGNTKPAPEVSKIDAKPIDLAKEETEAELARLFLMDIGGRELITLTRHDQIAGINQEYSPIKNLSNIALEYNPLAISPNADNVSTYLTLFNFDITKYVPTQQELNEEYPLEENASKRSVVYFDKTTNSLIVHVKNTFTNERIEVEFIIPEGVKDGTIYT
jgi:hypothetical protein